MEVVEVSVSQFEMSSGEAKGFIEVIVGGLGSGKTESMLRLIKRSLLSGEKIQVFSHSLDTRYSKEGAIVTHDGYKWEAQLVSDSEELKSLLDFSCDSIFIDEINFFDEGLVDLVDSLANSGKKVICSGLDLDYKGDIFLVSAKILAKAEFVHKLHAICVSCKGLASRTFRKSSSKELIEVGGLNIYDPVCRSCFLKRS